MDDIEKRSINYHYSFIKNDIHIKLESNVENIFSDKLTCYSVVYSDLKKILDNSEESKVLGEINTKFNLVETLTILHNLMIMWENRIIEQENFIRNIRPDKLS